jgi:hypothetical protein
MSAYACASDSSRCVATQRSARFARSSRIAARTRSGARSDRMCAIVSAARRRARGVRSPSPPSGSVHSMRSARSSPRKICSGVTGGRRRTWTVHQAKARLDQAIARTSPLLAAIKMAFHGRGTTAERSARAIAGSRTDRSALRSRRIQLPYSSTAKPMTASSGMRVWSCRAWGHCRNASSSPTITATDMAIPGTIHRSHEIAAARRSSVPDTAV